jgi:aminoglycoside phosphotransferase (APT) family kinase protein
MAQFNPDRLRDTTASWIELANRAGVDPQPYRLTPIWQKAEINRAHLLIRADATGLPSYIVKREFLRPGDDSLVDEASAQQTAHDALKHCSITHTPEVLSVTESGPSVLMQAFDGQNLNDFLVTGNGDPSRHLDALARAGGWLNEFHKATFVEHRQFRPNHMAKQARRLEGMVKAKERFVPRRAHFHSFVEYTTALAPQFEGMQTPVAQTHGDLHVRNLLIGPCGTAGIDFRRANSAPIGHDVARFLVDYATLFGLSGSVGSGQLLTAREADAFFSAYRMANANDPSIGFLIHFRILADWMTIPSSPFKRSKRQHRRWRGLKRCVRHLVDRTNEKAPGKSQGFLKINEA